MRREHAIGILLLTLASLALLQACDTECDKAFRDLSACCAKHPPDAGECVKLGQQTFVDAGVTFDAGPDASVDAGQLIEVPCEGTWLDYARNLLNKGLDPATCAVKP